MNEIVTGLVIGGVPAAELPDAADVTVALTGTGPAYAVLANARGAAAQVRAAWGTLESQYDAFLAVNPSANGPDDRRVLLTRVRQWLRTGNEIRSVGAGAVTAFRVLSARAAEWHFSQQGVRWLVRLELGEGNAVCLSWVMQDAPGDDAEMLIRPDLENRSFHESTKAFTGPEHALPAAVKDVRTDGFSFDAWPGAVLEVSVPGAAFSRAPEWFYMVPLPCDAERGLSNATDVFSPGVFSWRPARQIYASLHAGIGTEMVVPALNAQQPGHFPERQSLPACMEQALDLFLARRDGEWTVIAGFPWFLDWGRDSLIFVRGLIAAGRLEESAAIIRRFAAWELSGSIPNLVRGSDATNRETSDAPLWLVLAVRDLSRVQPGLLQQQAGGRSIARIVCDLISSHLTGAAHGVRYDAASGLLWSPPHFTWMDTNDPAGTPRQGYPVCIQAFWAAALEFAHELDPARGWSSLAARVRASIDTLFWREEEGFLADCLHAEAETPAAEAEQDDHLRPNQLFAVTFGAVGDPEKRQRIVKACECLIVPGALRTLAPRPVTFPLPVTWQGRLLNDPHAPYFGRYTGPENATRKPAYHNGTAWTWVFPSWCEALVLACGASAVPAARRVMGTSAALMQDGCLGQLAEIIDGDSPHRLRGCGAQAWSASEWVRVWRLLEG